MRTTAISTPFLLLSAVGVVVDCRRSTWCCGYDNDNGKRTPCAMAMATMEIDGRARVAIERECLETGRRIYLWMTFTIFVCLSLSSHLRVSYEKGKKSDTKNGGKNSEAKWRERKCCEAGRNIAQPSTALRPPPPAFHSQISDSFEKGSMNITGMVDNITAIDTT